MAISYYDRASIADQHTDTKGQISGWDIPVGSVGTVSAGQYLLSSIMWTGTTQDVTTTPDYFTVNGGGADGGTEQVRHTFAGCSIQQFAGFMSAGSTSSTINGYVQPDSAHYGAISVGLILDIDSTLVSLTEHTASGTGAVPTSYTHTGVHLRPGDFVRVVMVNVGSGNGATSSASLSMPGITFGTVDQRWCFSGSVGGTIDPGSGPYGGYTGAQWSQFTTTVSAGTATDTLTVTPGSFTGGGSETDWFAFVQVVHEATLHDASASLSAESNLTADATAFTPLGYANALGGPAVNLSSPNRLGVSKASDEGYATAGNFDVVLAMDNGTWTWSPGDTGKMRVWDAQGSWYGKVEDIHADVDNGNIAILSGIMPATPSGTSNTNIEIDIDDGVLGCIRWGVSWATGGDDAHVVRTYDTGGIASYTTTSQLFDLGTDWDIQTGDQFMFLCWAIEQRPTASVSTPTASAVSLFASGATAVTTQRYTKMTPLAANNYFWGGNANEIGVRLSGYTASITGGSATSPDIIASFSNTNADVVRWTVVQVRQGAGPGGGGPTTHNGASALSVQSEGSASATWTAFVGAALAAATVLTSVGGVVAPGDAALSGESGLTASGFVLLDGTAALTAESNLTADSFGGQSGTADLSAESVLTAAGDYIAGGSAALTVESVVTATGLQGWVASSALSADSGVTATGVRATGASSALVGNSAGSFTGEALTGGSTAMSGQSVLTATATATFGATSALTAESDLVNSSVQQITTQQASAALSAESSLFSQSYSPVAFRGEFMSAGTAGPAAPAEDWLWDVNDQVWQAGDTVVGFQSRANGWLTQSSHADMPSNTLLESHNQTQRWGNIVAEENHPEMGHVAWFRGVAPDSRASSTSYVGNIDTWFDRYQYTSHGIIVSGAVASVQHLTTGWVHQNGASSPASFSFPNVHLQERDQILVRYMSGSRYDFQVGGNRISSHVLSANGVTFGGYANAKVIYNNSYKNYLGDDTGWQRKMVLSSTRDSVTSGLGEDVTLTLTPTYNTGSTANWHRLDILIVSEWDIPAPVHDATVALTATGTLTGSSRVNGVATTVTDTAAALTAGSNFTSVGDYVAAGVVAMSGETDMTAANQKDLEYFYSRGGPSSDNDLTEPYGDLSIATFASDTSLNPVAAGDLLWAFYSSEEADNFGDYSGALKVQGSSNWVGQRWAKTNTVGNYKNHVVLLGIADQANTGVNYESYIRGLYGNSRHGYGGHMRSVRGGFDVEILQYQEQNFSSGVVNRNLGSIDLAEGDQVMVMYALSDTVLNSVATFTAAGKTLSAAVAHPVRIIGQRYAIAYGVDKPQTRHYCDWFEVTAGSAGQVDLYANMDIGSSANLDLLDVIVLRVRNSFEPLPVTNAASISAESDLASDAGVYVAPITLTGESGLASAGFIVTEAGSALTAETGLATAAIQVNAAGAALSVESDSTADAVRIVPASSDLVGNTTGSFIGFAITDGGVAMSSTATLAATGFVITDADSALTVESDATATGVAVILTPTSAMSAESDWYAGALSVQPAGASLTAESDLTTAGDYIATGAATLVGGSAASLTAVAVRPGDVALVASSSLTADGFVILGGHADLTAESDLAVAGVMLSAAAALSADSGVNAAATQVRLVSSAMSADSTLAVSGVTLLGSASLTGESDLASAGTPVRPAASTVSAQSDLTADGWVIFGGAVAISSESTLGSNATQVRLVTAGLSGQSAMVGTAKRITRVTSALTGQGVLTAQGGTKALAQSTLSATLTVTASGGYLLNGGTATMTVQSHLEPPDYEYFVGVPNSSVALSGQSELTAVTSPIYRLHLPSLERTYTQDRLWKRYPMATAACLIIKDGVATVKDWPNDLELKQADYYWMGGYNNPLTSETRQVIIDAGYGDLIEEA